MASSYYFDTKPLAYQQGQVPIQQQQLQRPGQTVAPQGRQGQGINAQGVAGAIGGAASIAGDAIELANEKLGLDGLQAGSAQQDPYSAPVYTGGTLAIQAANAKAKGASAGNVLKSAGTGAAAGAAFGPIGIAAGAVVGAGVSLIAGGVKRKRQAREKARAQGRAQAAANDFNTADVSYRNRYAAQEEYRDNMSDDSRMYNLLRSQY